MDGLSVSALDVVRLVGRTVERRLASGVVPGREGRAKRSGVSRFRSQILSELRGLRYAGRDLMTQIPPRHVPVAIPQSEPRQSAFGKSNPSG